MVFVTDKVAEFLKKNKGYAYLREFKEQKIYSRDLNKMLENGTIERIKRGLYRLTDLPHPKDVNMSFVDISKALKSGVVCLISALEYYGLTTQNPGENYIAVPMNHTKLPKIEYPPIRVFYFSEKFYNLDITLIETIYGPVKIYSVEKTICDIFRYRKKLGEDIAIEALKEYVKRRGADFFKLNKIAKICRIDKIIDLHLKVIVG